MSEIGEKNEENKNSFDPSQKLLDLLLQNELKSFRSLLESHTNIDIFSIHDKRNYNLLHVVCLNNQTEMYYYLMDYPTKRMDLYEGKDLKSLYEIWVNEITEEGYSPLHLISFRGNLRIIYSLVDYGADVFKENSQGLNCLHIAAQGDQIGPLVFYKEKGLDVYKKDNKGSTPLHWASYIGSENAVSFLVTWIKDLNILDGEGLTPLHLAVLAGNSKIVKKLLVKGADRMVKDQTLSTPADLARKNEYVNILSMLEPKNKCLRFLNIKSAIAPVSKNNITVFAFLILYIFGGISNICFAVQGKNSEDNNIDINHPLMILFLISFSLELLVFLCVWLKNPGYLPKNPDTHVLTYLEKNVDAKQICPDCYVIKPKRSKHCDICNRCVGVYDHHCPWINNCVGMNNHRWFLAFILNTYTFLVLVMIVNILGIVGKDLVIQAFRIMNLVLVGIFIFPLTVLIYIQLVNFLLNKTTAERFGFDSRRQQSYGQTSSQLNSVELQNTIGEVNKIQLLEKNASSNRGVFIYGKNCYSMCIANSSNETYSNTLSFEQ